MSRDERHSSRREILASSLKLIGAGAIVAVSALGPARVAAQDDDEGIGAGGRQDGGGGGGRQDDGLGAGGRMGGDGGGGRRRRQDDAGAPDGVGAGGRSTMVTSMPSTGVGDMDASVAPLLLAAGAVGAAALAMQTRTISAEPADL